MSHYLYMRVWWIAVVLACSHTQSSPPSTTATPANENPPAETPKRRLVVTSTDVELLDPIEFLPASASLDPRSTPILDAVARTLIGNPSIELVEVQAFAVDALAQFRARIAAERAQIIVDQLVARGVDRARLTPAGYATLPSGTRGEPLLVVVRRTN